MDAKEFLSWIPGWLGFLALIIVGAAMTLHGAVNPIGATLDQANKVGFIVFGLCALIVGAASWIIGATSEITDRSGKVGVKVKIQDLPWWGYLVDAGVVTIAIILFFVLKG